MSDLTWRRVGIGFGVWSTGCWLLGVGLLVEHRATGSGPLYGSWFEVTINGAAFIVVGLVLTLKLPGNRVGPLFATIGFIGATQLPLAEYAFHNSTLAVPPAGAPWAGWASAGLSALLMPTLALIALNFPDGRLPSRHWRPLVVVLLVGGFVWLVAGQFRAGDLEDLAYRNPAALAVGGRVLRQAWHVGTDVVVAATLVSMFSIVVRWRRGDAMLRQQLKAFLVAAAGLPLAFLLIVALPHPPGWLSHVGFGLAVVALAVGATVAVTRYRLYELDRVVSRTVSYAIVTALLVAFYAGLVTLVTRLLPSSNSLAVAASTLAVAALFQPVRRRVQAGVDRRFNRARYDAGHTIDAFSSRLREQVDLDSLEGDLLGVVRRTVQPTSVSLWLRESA
ncbi:MAG: hypothetical protein M3Z02_08135 [Actinomycetota bacterium]|nr:hypothetical protein [Actinomycetota bacterium]